MTLRERVEMAKRRANMAVAKIPDAPEPPKASRLRPRDELLGDIRARLQEEVIEAFETLIEASENPAEVRTRIVALVDRIITEQ